MKDRKKDRLKSLHSGRAVFVLMIFIVVIIAVGVLKIASSIILPCIIAILLSFVLTPAVNFLKRLHIPRIVSIFLLVAVILCSIYILGMILFSSGRTLLTLYPKYEFRIMEIYERIAILFRLPYNEQLSFFENAWGQLGIRTWVRDATFILSNGFIGFLKDALVVVFILVFLLIEASYIQKKIEMAFEDKRANQVMNMTKAIASQVTRYLTIKFLISLVNGILVGISLAFVGLEFPLLWGVAQFILNFIPTLGSIAIGVIATTFALIQFWPDLSYVIIVALIMLSINIVLGNVLDPKIMGDNLGVSPLVVLVSLLVWGWIWGFVGMILAVPMVVIVKIVCENVVFLEPISILLGSKKACLAKETEMAEENPPELTNIQDDQAATDVNITP